jgi:hypothetical protein
MILAALRAAATYLRHQWRRTEGEPMTEHSHCWHNKGSWSDERGTHKSEQCCHCGVYRTVVPPSPHTNLSGVAYALPVHGPYAPQVNIRFEAGR